MFSQSKKAIRLFDKYTLAISEKLNCHEDGIPGRRVVFLSDSQESFLVSFEEDMKLMDMLPGLWENDLTVTYEYRKGNTYIHQRRKNSDSAVCAFFHFELQDPDGTILYLPGQLVADASYKWSEGIEPVLLELMDGLTV